MSETKKLFTQFPPLSTKDWMDKVNADLKGADFDKKLVWKSKDGINVNPFYRKEDIEDLNHIGSLPGEYPYVRGKGDITNSWYIRQDIIVGDPVVANKKALDILNKGVNSLGFIFHSETRYSLDFIDSLLKGVFIESIELNFSPNGYAIELLDAFKEYIKVNGIKPDMLNGSIEADPIGRYMVNGKLCIPIDEGIAYLKGLIERTEDMSKFRIVRISGASFSNAGASIIQELGLTISMGNEYMAHLTDNNIDPATIARSIGFNFGVGSNYFFEIAKVRAARMLWATLVKKYGVSEDSLQAMDIHAVTSEWNKTKYDPYVNMLRTQTEAMSATLGGVDSLTVNSFNSASNEPSEFSERIARNQQLLLKEESHFDRVVDPGAGSYYIENLTASLAEQAWDLFIEIENEGGFLASLKAGLIQKRVENNADKRNSNLSKGREKLLGTNIYPNFDESVSEEMIKGDDKIEEGEIRPIKMYRGAEMFENLRRSTEKFQSRPKVFMLTIGNPVMRKARAQFSSNFFSVAGYEIIDNKGFINSDEGVKAAIEAKADIVVLCSSDEEYATIAPEVFDGLKGKAILVIAGAPECENELREKGIESFVNMRSDILRTLQSFNSLLGIN